MIIQRLPDYVKLCQKQNTHLDKKIEEKLSHKKLSPFTRML